MLVPRTRIPDGIWVVSFVYPPHGRDCRLAAKPAFCYRPGDENTLVIFTSDNGSTGRNGGSNDPLSGNKGQTMEGGMRVPMIARWHGKIPSGEVCHALTTTMDILPTFAAITSAPLPKRKIDGHNILPLLNGETEAESPDAAIYYYRRRQLQAVRHGQWKWHLPLEQQHPNWASAEPTSPGRPGKLVHLGRDLQETNDLSGQHPEVVEQMRRLAEVAIQTLGNEEQEGSEQRPATDLEHSVPLVLKTP